MEIQRELSCWIAGACRTCTQHDGVCVCAEVLRTIMNMQIMYHDRTARLSHAASQTPAKQNAARTRARVMCITRERVCVMCLCICVLCVVHVGGRRAMYNGSIDVMCVCVL